GGGGGGGGGRRGGGGGGGCGGGGWGGGGQPRPRRINHSDHRVDRHRLAFANLDLLQHARRRRWNFRVHLVRRNFEERLVALDFVTELLQPLSDRSFKNAFPHLGHYDIGCHCVLLCFVKLISRQFACSAQHFFFC